MNRIRICLPLLISACCALTNSGMLDAQQSLTEVLQKPLVSSAAISAQHKSFVLSNLARLPKPESAKQWSRQAASIRARVLDEVVFRGVPKQWRAGQLQVQWLDDLETGKEYRIRRLRFQAVPGLWIPAVLYEPLKLEGKVPVVLNVNGHERTGKSTEYKQIRCINQAKRGMIALNVEWLGMGQLRRPGLSHNHLAKLDLTGRSGLSVFFLAMSRGLDVLLDHKHADPRRVAVTGLSGGGWQTIILSSLDTRVTLAVPVAGHSAIAQRLEHRGSIGDLEQIPNDLGSIADYVHLNALMAPRPLLLIYNTKDTCCFVANTVKANTYEPTIAFYRQAGAMDRLGYHENNDPGNHNYERDNRQQLYKFLIRHFSLPQRSSEELDSTGEIRTHQDLTVPLPKAENIDFNTLAAAAAEPLPKSAGATKSQQRAKLRELLRYRPSPVSADLYSGPQRVGGLAVRSMRLKTGNQWILPAVMVESMKSGASSPGDWVVLMADKGYGSLSQRAQELAEAGKRVLLFDPVLIGQANPAGTLYQNAMLMSTVGRRPLGEQTAQLLSVASFVSRVHGVTSVDVETQGPRTGLVARCAAALDGGSLLAAVKADGESLSLKDYLQPSANYATHPEAYCFGLLEYFDVPQLKKLAAP